jgi:hypothetical protein
LYGDLYADIGQGKKVLKTELQEVQEQCRSQANELNPLQTEADFFASSAEKITTALDTSACLLNVSV